MPSRRDPEVLAAAAASYALIDRGVQMNASWASGVPLHLQPAKAKCCALQEGGELGHARGAKGSSAFSPICISSNDASEESSASDVDSFRSDSHPDHELSSDDGSGNDDADAGGDREDVQRPGRNRSGELWNNEQFPDGYHPGYVSSMENLRAAQAWSCPCNDRASCIGADRIDIFKLYEFRKAFRERHGGASLRDALRVELEAHFDTATAQFTRSFVVAQCGDCCAASAGIARGVSFATFANARADTRKDRSWHLERRAARQARCQPSSLPLVHTRPLRVLN